jgi:hypothetical protein
MEEGGRMAFQGGFIFRRLALVGTVQKYNGWLRLLTTGQSWRPFEVVSSCNRHGPAAGPAR